METQSKVQIDCVHQPIILDVFFLLLLAVGLLGFVIGLIYLAYQDFRDEY